MSITLLQSDASEVRVSVTEAMRYMGVREDATEIKAIAEHLLPELRNAAGPKACFAKYPVVFGESSVSVGGIVTESAALRRNLDGCVSAVIFAATLGIGVDRLVARYSRTTPSKAVILASLGSAMIEGWYDEVCAVIEREQQNIGKCIKPRFSPGYGGFELSAQRKIADIMETEKRIGLYFTKSLMMIPEKSVTAIVGIYDK